MHYGKSTHLGILLLGPAPRPFGGSHGQVEALGLVELNELEDGIGKRERPRGLGPKWIKKQSIRPIRTRPLVVSSPKHRVDST